jgi:DNA helicase IV
VVATAAVDVFDLPPRLADKATEALIGNDRAHFDAVAECIDQRITRTSARLTELLSEPGRRGRGVMDRDTEIHRLSGQLRALRRYGLDICLGRMVAQDGTVTYIGRLGLLDAEDRVLLVDWRAPAAEPFFAATAAEPLGLVSRRRYRWMDGRIRDYWDELLDAGGHGQLALDQDSAFIASLAAGRSARMRDVLSTIQADQDAIIRAGSSGALVVEGGPGTGKTVVALHRAAYLLYADPRLKGHRGGVLVVGPHQPYLAYVADVLPSLGEDGVRTCTVRDLVDEGASVADEPDPQVAALKGDRRMLAAIEPAVRLYEEPPTSTLLLENDWFDVVVTAADWAEAFGSAEPGTSHNQARDEVWAALIEILADKVEADDLEPEAVQRLIRGDEDLRDAFGRAWPILDGAELVGDLWSVKAYLRRCAPRLSEDEVQLLQRRPADQWTSADLPLLDQARRRVGDPKESARARQRERILAEQSQYRDDLVEYLLANDDDPESPLQLLRRDSLRDALLDEDAAPSTVVDQLAGPFAHIIVDEAQELSDAEWQMLIDRCPSRSFTIVGDRAQARRGFTGTWTQRLAELGFTEIQQSELHINYRTPSEVMDVAEPVIRAVMPDANVPTSIRTSGAPVRHGRPDDASAIVTAWLEAHAEGVVCVIGETDVAETDRVRVLTPATAKGLEFDLVVLIGEQDPGVTGAVDRYVAMTRATSELVILDTEDDRA